MLARSVHHQLRSRHPLQVDWRSVSVVWWAPNPQDASLHDGDRADQVVKVVVLDKLVDGNNDGITRSVGGADHHDSAV